MSILETIKSLLGMGEKQSRADRRRRTDRETTGHTSDAAEPATASEAAVKGTDEPDEPAGSGTDASASTSTLVDEEEGTEPAEVVGAADTATGEAAEPAEATGPVAEESTPDEPAVDEPEADAGAEEPESDADDTDDTDVADTEVTDAADADDAGEPLTVIKGIGPSYAETLSAAGIDTVAQLAAADPDAVADDTGISPKRLERWVGRAKHR